MSSFTNPKATVFFIEIFLFAVHIGLLDNWLLFFLMQKNSRPSSVRIANVCSVFTVILYFVIPVSVITINHDWVHTATNSECVWCSYFIPHSSVIFLYYAYSLLYLLGIMGAQSGLMRCLGHKGSIFRPYVMGWASFLFCVYFARAVSITLLYTKQAAASHCISYASTVLYTVGYIPILYYTLKNDSEFCILNKLDENVDEDETPLLQDDVFTGLPVYDFTDINLIQEIGKGGFGVVYRSAINTEIVAVKRVHPNKQSKDQGYKEFLKEVSILSRVSHPNILGFIGICKNPLCIITEFMSRGSVYEIVHTRKEQLSDSTKRRILLDTAKGMAYLHSINIIHRDLKPHNILVDNKWNSKVADFGLARTKVATTMTRVGTPRWVAPEVIREEKYSDLADVFSFGVICWELETEEVPFANLTPLQILTKLAYEKLALQIPAHTSPQYADFISKCLSDTPSLRPTFNEIITSLENM